MIGRFETFIHNLSEIDLYWHRLASNEMAKFGLKGNWAIYFTQLYHHPEGLTNVQLQQLCSKDKSDVSRDMRQLEERGFITKSGPTQYRQIITLTQQGARLTEGIVRRAEAVVDFIGNTLTEEERTTFYRAFNEIATRMRELSNETTDK